MLPSHLPWRTVSKHDIGGCKNYFPLSFTIVEQMQMGFQAWDVTVYEFSDTSQTNSFEI